MDSQSIGTTWKEVLLSDCLETVIDYRWKTPGKSNQGILTLSAKSVKNWFIDYAQAYTISQEAYDGFMVRWFPKKGDILMTTEAPLGCIAKLNRDDVAIAQRLLTLRGKNGVLENDYLMYYLQSERGQHELLSKASGSTVQGIKRSEFEKVIIWLPPFDEQQRISRTLSSLNDKIELLRKQNETLEKAAQAIYHEQYGRYSVDDELPEKWRIGSFTDGINILAGGTPSTTNETYWNGEIPWFSVVDCPWSGSFVFETKKTITHSGLENSVARILPVGTTILTARGTVWKTAIVWREMAMNQSCFGLKSKSGYDYFTYFDTLNILRILKSRVHGAVFDTITRDTLSSIESVVPDEGSISYFESTVSPLFEKMKIVTTEIKTISETRNALLPKLMNGELRVGILNS